MNVTSWVFLLVASASLLVAEGVKFVSVCPTAGTSNCVSCTGARACLDLSSDSNSCGACFKACGPGQLINLQYGAFSTCDTVTGDGISQTARCSDPANVPAYPLIIPPSTFNNFGVGVYNPAAPRCLWLSTCTTQIAFNNASVQIDLRWDPAVPIIGTTFTNCVSRNCPDGSAGSQIIIANSGSVNGETVYIASASGLCVSGVSAMARMSMDCSYNTPMPIP
ncbi:hypothetical protein OEZ86_002263 [Tetradesmus obliquus]|nr:hypothetical protein OEZ86_002263 [Tetradesmus obliquus]